MGLYQLSEVFTYCSHLYVNKDCQVTLRVAYKTSSTEPVMEARWRLSALFGAAPDVTNMSTEKASYLRLLCVLRILL